MTSSQETLDAVPRRAEHGVHSWRNTHMRNQESKILKIERLGLQDTHTIRRGCRLKTDCKEDYLFIGILTSDLDRVQGRINNAHIASSSADREQVLF
jgi:hypothetical protein